jgi:hypothetical protein
MRGSGIEIGRWSRCAAYWRLFLAPSMVRRGASGWGSVSGPLKPSVARPIRPCCAGSPPYVRHHSGHFEAACRCSSVPVTTSRSVIRTLRCHLAESPDLSPPPPRAIAVSATFRRLARLTDARAGSEVSTVNVYPKRSTLGASVLFCFFEYRVGYWGTPWGPPPAPRPRRAQQWQYRAAPCGVQRQSPNRPIARRIRRRRGRQELLRVRRFRLRRIGRECASRVPAAVCRAGRRRCTVPRAMAVPHACRSCCCAAPTGPSRTTAGTAVLRRTAELKTAAAARAQAHAEAIHQFIIILGEAQARGVRGGGEPGALRPPAHSPRPLRAPSLPALLVPTDVPSALAVGARRSSGQGGDAALAL